MNVSKQNSDYLNMKYFDFQYINSLEIFNLKTKDGEYTAGEYIHPHRVSGDLETGGYEITDFITSTTTPEEFDAKIATVAGYHLRNGGKPVGGWGEPHLTALQKAFNCKNERLVRHIATIGGEEIVNLLGPATPLGRVETVEMAQHLIKCGANVNGAKQVDEDFIITPIQTKINQKQYDIALYLYRQGAILDPRNAEAMRFKASVEEKSFLVVRMIFDKMYREEENKQLPYLPDELLVTIANHLSPWNL